MSHSLPSRLREGTGEGMDGQSPKPAARACDLRNNATLAERVLRRALSAREITGIRLNRQVPIGPNVCDFVSRGAKPVIEVDGGQHGWRAEQDRARSALIEARGFRVLRFWNDDVVGRLQRVASETERLLAELSSPDPSRQREG